uniref:Uncharacterized protein n=2 Tax=unclassified Caudoviricetes TaxID=2788787 RepID=A0A8S5MVT1_9CAUD|nr:MAG TPA: hypothetical protein [Siphoviridae sp. ctsBB38]DAF99139.1 MAG TPA: hypothetical protein [Siphoviridae sp. ctOxh11]
MFLSLEYYHIFLRKYFFHMDNLLSQIYISYCC